MEILADPMIACEPAAPTAICFSRKFKRWQTFSIAACLKISGFLASLILLSIASAAIAQTVLQRGDSGDQVVELQRRLTQVGCYNGDLTGTFGSLTEAAVKQCQSKYGLEPDGIVGAETYAVLFQSDTPTPTTPTTPYNPPAYGQVLKNGDVGDAVRRIQERLRSLGFYQGEPDGYFGSETERAVRAFQRSRGIAEDGVVGEQVYRALEGRTPPVTTPDDRPIPRGGLSYGDRGEQVRELQRRLNASGYSVTVDGEYGDETATAVRRFQQQRGLPASGVADSRTLEELGVVGAVTVKNRYAVIVPKQDATTLPQVQRLFPQAQLKIDRRGDYVRAGAYATPEQADYWTNRLRSRGLDARVIFE
jgi:peptidoglycan hydrolase-like protein with peptidoglycan-binding domain